MSDDPASNQAFLRETRMAFVSELSIPWDGMGEMANAQRALAARMIVDLMNEIEAWVRINNLNERDIEVLQNTIEHLNKDRNNAVLLADAALYKKEQENG